MRKLRIWSWFQVSNLLVTINSSVNLFVYCVFGERFRNELKKMLRPLARRVKKVGHFCGLWWWLQKAGSDGATQDQAPAPTTCEDGFRDDPRTLAATDILQSRRGNKTGEKLETTAKSELLIKEETQPIGKISEGLSTLALPVFLTKK